MDYHSIDLNKIYTSLKTDPKSGLTESEARSRLSAQGKNIISSKKKQSIPVKFLSQFSDFMVLILLAAAGVSFITSIISGSGDLADPIMILIIVILNAAIGTAQECKAEKAVDALKKMSQPSAEVIRGGKARRIPTEDIVPGDLIPLRAGCRVCADARLISSSSLRAEESALTGESVPSEKQSDILCPSDAMPGDRHNMVYASTFITSGSGTAIVTQTGMNTQVGKIASMINEEESPKTPLQKKLNKTGRILGIAALIICGVIFLLGMLSGFPALDMFMISVSLAVAAIPEGLPAVVTIVLAMGVRSLAKHRAVVRHLPAVETLGSAAVICSDKTGTLTQNRMTVAVLCDSSKKISIHSSEGKELLTMGALCSDAKMTDKGICEGEPTECAVVTAAFKSGGYHKDTQRLYKRVNEFPFDSKRKRMSTVHRLSHNSYRTIVKGAPDILIRLCTGVKKGSSTIPLTEGLKKEIMRLNDRLAGDAMRIIAVAYKDGTMPQSEEDAESGLTFCGLIGMYDPPRPQAKSAVARCKKAGIKPVMITGDHPVTAVAIARELDIYQSGDRAATGEELDRLSDEELAKNIFSYSVFARVSPEHKVRIVKAFQKHGAVTAMTGDGVNDAPALKRADIGCAMGKSGTDVAKNAADMILTDDNFSTIVEAVEHGRGIFENIKRTIHFLLSSNIGEILTVFAAFLLHLPSPLAAIQLLWINLVTDSLPALALGSEPAPSDIMDKPSDASGGIFGNGAARAIIAEGCFIGALSFLAFTIGRIFFDTGNDPVIGRTMTFAVLSLSQLVHSFDLRSEHSLFKTGIFGNPRLIGAFLIGAVMQITVISVPSFAKVFSSCVLSPIQWLIVFILSLMPVLFVEAEKLLSGYFSRKKHGNI